MTTLTTPAMASEPYCADAPSRRTSTRSTAPLGMAFRSTPLEPAPMPYANVFIAAIWWRRHPCPRGTAEQNCAMAVQPIALSPVDVTVGSRARHTAAEELAVPVDR